MAGTDDTSESSEEDSVLILTQYHTTHDAVILTQDQCDRSPINSDLVLLDSQSTVDLFSNPGLVDNIRPSKHPINIHCNKGTLTTSEEADFGATPVYFDERGIANVLSLYRLGQKFHVTYDSTDRGGVFRVGDITQDRFPRGLAGLWPVGRLGALGLGL